MNYGSDKNRNLSEYINRTSGRLLIIFTIIIAILIVTPLAAASELDDFEEAATTDNEQKSDDQKKEEEEDDDDVNFFFDFYEIIFDVIFSVFDGTDKSLARIGESTETDLTKIDIRQTGEPTLPFFQLEHRYMRVSSDIKARDNSLEFGYGPYGFNCRNTGFYEKNPSDKLTLTQYHFLLRISATRSREYGIGVGRLAIRGNEDNSGSSLTFPMKFYPKESFGIRFTPTYSRINGNSIDDYDLSFAYTKRFGTIELGYRFLEANGVDLDGSYIGFALHY